MEAPGSTRRCQAGRLRLRQGEGRRTGGGVVKYVDIARNTRGEGGDLALS